MVSPYAPLRAALGDKTADALADGLGLRSVDDLLRHYPRRYAERGELSELRRLPIGEHVTVLAEIAKVTARPMRHRRGRLLEVIVTDGTGRLKLTFFNQAWRQKELVVGRRGLFAGKVGDFRGQRQLAHPDYQLLDDTGPGLGGVASAAEEFVSALIPVYPATAALPSWNIAKAVGVALDAADLDDDPLPAELRMRHRLPRLRAAFEGMHRPSDPDAVAAGRRRLIWDEAMVLQVTLAQRRRAAAAEPTPARSPRPGGLLDAFDARLPFTLTDGQRKVGERLTAELSEPQPMHRLLQGEVGSGKTVVALRAMLQVIDAGGQAALLAPTEVLAVQHARSLRALLGPLAEAGRLAGVDEADRATRLTLLTGSLGAVARREALLEAASGQAGIVVGTHALLEGAVQFADLGLVVIDEQHRFGVEQRDALRTKSEHPPHVLVMTATPIPRTVAMTVYGDLETSALTELPHGRTPIATSVVPVAEKPAWLDRAWQRVREEAEQGRQVFVLCPRIGQAEGDGPAADPPAGGGPPAGAAVVDVLPALEQGPLAGLRIAALHGQLSADASDDVMGRFAGGEIDVLVATTVVEVGIDIPNASVMVILDAEHFGVSQLHQLRGRVGRGEHPGLCLLVTDSAPGTSARERLDAVAATLDGAALARLDLEQRREGDVLGASQSGRRSGLRLLRLLRDEEIIAAAREEATALVEQDPALRRHPRLARAITAEIDPERAEYLDKT